MPNRLKHQQGLTLISWVFVIALALFFVLIGIRMFPVYLENYAIEQVLSDVEEDRRLRDASRSELKRILLKRFQVNGVYELGKDDIVIKSNKEGLLISIDYEVRKPVIGNVAIVMDFSESATLRK